MTLCVPLKLRFTISLNASIIVWVKTASNAEKSQHLSALSHTSLKGVQPFESLYKWIYSAAIARNVSSVYRIVLPFYSFELCFLKAPQSTGGAHDFICGSQWLGSCVKNLLKFVLHFQLADQQTNHVKLQFLSWIWTHNVVSWKLNSQKGRILYCQVLHFIFIV